MMYGLEENEQAKKKQTEKWSGCIYLLATLYEYVYMYSGPRKKQLIIAKFSLEQYI